MSDALELFLQAHEFKQRTINNVAKDTNKTPDEVEHIFGLQYRRLYGNIPSTLDFNPDISLDQSTMLYKIRVANTGTELRMHYHLLNATMERLR